MLRFAAATVFPLCIIALAAFEAFIALGMFCPLVELIGVVG